MKKDKTGGRASPRTGAHAPEPGSHRLPVSQSISRLISFLLYFLLLIIQRTNDRRLFSIPNYQLNSKKVVLLGPTASSPCDARASGKSHALGSPFAYFFFSRATSWDFRKWRACSQLTPHHPPFPHICWKFYSGIGLNQGQKSNFTGDEPNANEREQIDYILFISITFITGEVRRDPGR